MPPIFVPPVRGLLTKNNTPFLAVTKATSRLPPRAEVAVIVRGRYALVPGEPLKVIEGMDQGFLTGQLTVDDDDWMSAAVYPDDLADHKPHAEVLVHATCHAPKNQATPACTAQVSLGSWSKTLRIIGDRRWKGGTGKGFTEPEPFTEMPIRWERAFGTPDHTNNPVGRGPEIEELPNIESAFQLLNVRGDTPEPAGFGPINSEWPVRALRRGTEYGERYLADRSPFYAADFDWTHFQAAPSDQWLPEAPRGDESMRFVNLHPDNADFSVALPGVRVRAFTKDIDGLFLEVPMAIDTIFVDLEEGHLTLTWRGLSPCMEDDARDIAWLLVAQEDLDGQEESPRYYRAQLEDYEKDPTGMLAEAPIMNDMIAWYEGKAPAGAADGSAESLAAGTSGGIADKVKPGVGKEIDKALKQLFDGQSKLPGKEEPQAAAAHAKMGELVDGLKKLKPSNETAPATTPLRPGDSGGSPLRKVMRAVKERAKDMREQLAKGGDQLPADQRAKLEATAKALDDLPEDPKWKQLDPDYEPPGELSTDEPAPYADLSERDFSGQDLSDRDLQGANFSGANLMGTNLKGANLHGANFKRAVLFRADVSGANLSNADLTQTHCGKAIADDASFEGATLEQTNFTEASLRSANLRETKGGYTSFEHADLTTADATQMKLERPTFAFAKIEGACFERAELEGAQFHHVQGRTATFVHAKLDGAGFEDAQLEGGVFLGISADKSYWAFAKLDGADFGKASLENAHFTEASAAGARFQSANLHGGRLTRVDLTDANFEDANLYQTDLCKTNLTGTSFRRACLLEAKLLKVIEKQTDYAEANTRNWLKQTV